MPRCWPRPATATPRRARLLNHLRALGRIRANRLEVLGAGGVRLYLSPASPYKAGRDAPAWFAGRVAPELAARRLDAGELEVVLTPDASRAVLDAWDHLVAALGWAAALLLAIWHEGIRLRCAIEPLGEPVDDSVGLALLRVIQESLTNVARHAGAHAVEVRVGLRRGHAGDADEIEIEVSDDGRGLGADPTPGRHGLAGMRERVAELHGRLELHSAPAGGLCVRARFPRPSPATTA